MKQATTSIFIDCYHPTQDNKYAVKLRVTYERERRYWKTKYKLSLAEFESVMGNPRKDEFKKIRRELDSMKVKADNIIEDLKSFDWNLFESKYTGTSRAAKSELNAAYESYITNLENEGQVSTGVSYSCAKRSINAFSPDPRFVDVTPEFLRKYEKWMISQGNSITTVGIYLRTLRTLFNLAISKGDILPESYPFGKRKYEIPTGSNIKKSLKLDDIAKIFRYKAEPGTNRAMAKDLWVFMYLCNGINVKDLCRLQYKNINGDMLSFERAKTSTTKRNVEQIRLSLQDEAKAIIERWGQPNKSPDTYIFPVLTKGLTPKQEYVLIQQKTGVINDHMKAIAEDVGINIKQNPCTTYVARHSFATVLKRSGASTEFISEALGHSNLKTTKNYLGSFEDETLKEVTKALTAF